MAHCLAFEGSRCAFSHEQNCLPLTTLRKISVGEHATMNLSASQNKERVPFCSAMNCLFRPTEFEKMCPHQFHSEIEVVRKPNKTKGVIHHEFLPCHPKKNTTTSRRKNPVVPTVDWTFFKNAKELLCPITAPLNPARAQKTEFDEECALRFLVAFGVHRKVEDLKLCESHKNRLIQDCEKGLFNDCSEIANNTQNIRNSLDAGTMNDDKPMEEMDDESEMDQTENDESRRIHSMISEFFDSESGTEKLTEEAVHCSMEEPSFDDTSVPNGPIWENEPQSVFVDCTGEKQKQKKAFFTKQRFVPSVCGMNTLIQQHFDMGNNAKGKRNIKPTGSVSSIIAFGVSNGLDEEQQKAFEILTATFVLTFIDDVMNGDSDVPFTEEASTLLQSKEELEHLAQTNKRKNKPLRMFLTGPAGAGKCE